LGALNKVSVFLNFDKTDLSEILENKSLRVSLHLNLVEGKCLADPCEIDLLADENGILKHTFGGLFKLNLFKRRKLEEQLYKELKAQIRAWKNVLPKGVPFCIDSHQHTHMIPAVFKMLVKVLEDENIEPEYVRIPAEPMLPFVKTPCLYFTYSPVNVVKQWLLKFLWIFDKKYAKKLKINKSLFIGILFSGKMDEKRLSKILPKIQKVSEKKELDTEVLFHPGYLDKSRKDLKNKGIRFEKFYISKNRKTEYDSVIKLLERRKINALH